MQITRITHCRPPQNSGFTLIEIAISLTVIAFLMVGGISMLRIQNERARFSETKMALEDANQALLGFAASHGHLPCPANPTEPIETIFGTAIPSDTPGCGSGTNRGIVPWRDLGINGTDGWGQYLSYEVTYALTLKPLTPGSTNFNLETLGTIKLRTSSTSGSAVVSDSATAFALWSHGPNGHYGISFQRVQQPASDQPGAIAANPDETINAPTITASPSTRILVTHDEVSSPSNPEKNFDDRFVWMSRFVLFRTISNAGYCIPHSGSTDTCNSSTSSSSSSSSSSSGSSSGAGSSSSGGSSTSSSGG